MIKSIEEMLKRAEANAMKNEVASKAIDWLSVPKDKDDETWRTQLCSRMHEANKNLSNIQYSAKAIQEEFDRLKEENERLKTELDMQIRLSPTAGFRSTPYDY